MKPIQVIKSFFDHSGIGYDQVDDWAITMALPVGDLTVGCTASTIGAELVVTMTFPHLIPMEMREELSALIGEKNLELDWGQLALDQKLGFIYAVVTIGIESGLPQELVQLGFEQAYGIACDYGEELMSHAEAG